MQLTVVCKSE